MLAQGFGQPLIAVLVVELHAARVGGDAQEIGDEQKQRLRIRRLEIAVERGEFIFLRAARIKLAHVADEDHLKGAISDGVCARSKYFKDRS